MMTVAPFGGATRNASPRSALRVQECCAACRRPLTFCSHSDHRATGSYWGTLLRGEWQEAETARTPQAGSAIHAAAPAESGARLVL